VYVILAAHYRLHELTRERKAFRQSITIAWHSFRHSLAANLRALSVDIKVAQELMRHSSCRTTLDVYTRAVDQQSGKRA
jgi:integrase